MNERERENNEKVYIIILTRKINIVFNYFYQHI